jgi:hypothetical protein
VEHGLYYQEATLHPEIPMTTSSKRLPKFLVAFSFAFCGLAGVASAAPNQNANRRAQPQQSVMSWQGGQAQAVAPKRMAKPAVNLQGKQAKRSNEKQARRSNAKRAERPNIQQGDKRAERPNFQQGDKRLADHKGGKRAHSPTALPAQQKQAWHARRLQKFDSNRDGKLSLAEKTAMKKLRLARLDANHDGKISPAEKRAARAKRTGARKSRS